MSPLEDGLALLEELRGEGLPFVVIGSAALALIAPALLERAPRDVDVLAPFDLAVLEGFIEALAARGTRVTSWEEPVELPLDEAKLAGRYYLRARGPAGRVLDVTYEGPLPFAEATGQAVRVRGLEVACLPHLLHLAAARGSARDCALIARAGAR